MKIGYVYKITSPSGKIYVGSTYNLKLRKNHYAKANCKNQTKLHCSLVKYGFNNHLFEVIWEGDLNEMYKKERELGRKKGQKPVTRKSK